MGKIERRPTLIRPFGPPSPRGRLGAEELVGEVCDYCCRFPREVRREEELENVCQECLVTRLMALMG